MDSDYVIAGDFNKDTGQVCAYNRQVICVDTNLMSFKSELVTGLLAALLSVSRAFDRLFGGVEITLLFVHLVSVGLFVLEWVRAHSA